MAELADALDSGSSQATGGCSSHLGRNFHILSKDNFMSAPAIQDGGSQFTI